MSTATSTAPRLKQRYNDEIRARLKDELGLDNIMQVPRFEKIVINSGVGAALGQQSLLEGAVRDLEQITGQKVVVTKAKKSIAGFKIREGYPIGCMVTLRGPRMFEFLDRLITVAMPRIRDFRGVMSKGFDGRGNYNLGVKEQIIFPEIEYDKIDALRGLNISITTTAKTDEEARALLAAFKRRQPPSRAAARHYVYGHPQTRRYYRL